MDHRCSTTQTWRLPVLARIAALCLAPLGCASAPPQTVELADVVLEQIDHIEQSHRTLVRAYFAQLEQRVNDFIDQQWIPDFLARAVENEDVQERLAQTRLGLDIDADELREVLVRSGKFREAEAQIVVDALDAEQLEYRVRFSNLMFDFSQAALAEINRVREAWRTRLRTGERELLAALDESYGNLRSGHLLIRAYLDSLVEVRALQDRIFTELGVLAERDALIAEIIASSESLASGSESLNEIIAELDDGEAGNAAPAPLDEGVMDRILNDLNAADGAAE